MPPRSLLRTSLVVLSLLLAGVPTGSGSPTRAAEPATRREAAQSRMTGVEEGGRHWRAPTSGIAIVAPFAAPSHEYGAGHRGVDLVARSGSSLTAPRDGVIAFSGTVAGRAVITIDHGGGYVSTLEPVAQGLMAGTRVSAGDHVADASVGGHASSGTVHFGVRQDGRYINPLLLLGDVPRAVLLPCC